MLCKSNNLIIAEKAVLESEEEVEETAEAEAAAEEEVAAVEAIAKVKLAAEVSTTAAAKTRAIKRAVTRADSNNHLPLALQIASERSNRKNQSSNQNIETKKQLKTLTIMIILLEERT